MERKTKSQTIDLEGHSFVCVSDQRETGKFCLTIKTSRHLETSAWGYDGQAGIYAQTSFFELSADALQNLGASIIQLAGKAREWEAEPQTEQGPKESGAEAEPDDGMAEAYEQLKDLMVNGAVYLSDAGNYVYRREGPDPYVVLGKTQYEAAKYLRDHPASSEVTQKEEQHERNGTR